MRNILWRVMMMLLLTVSIGTAVTARQQRATNLTPYLQAEVNEIAMLNAQWNYLQQQGDALGAALIASYIPDHQMQANFLSSAIQAQGGNPSSIQPTGTPFLGTRQAIIEHDTQAHQQVIQSYQRLASSTDPNIRQLALMGQSGAMRHRSSLIIARAATTGTPVDLQNGLLAALSLERGAVLDLQTQAARLQVLGDTNSATMLLNFVPAHQQQVAAVEALLIQMGGNPALATVAPVVALPSRADILQHERVMNMQLVNTYALPIASLPNSPLRNLALAGQQNFLTALTIMQSGMPAA